MADDGMGCGQGNTGNDTPRRMDEREFVAMTWKMDQLRAWLEAGVEKHSLSSRELPALCNMARLGMLYTFSQVCRDDADRARAEHAARLHMEAIRDELGDASPGEDPVVTLATWATAILAGARLGKFVIDGRE